MYGGLDSAGSLSSLHQILHKESHCQLLCCPLIHGKLQKVWSMTQLGSFRGLSMTSNTEREASVKNMEFLSCPFATSPGQPSPLGPSAVESGVNFALYTKHATDVTLCLSLTSDKEKPMIEIRLDPLTNKTGDVWHVCFENLPLNNIVYGYRVDGPQGWESGHRFDKTLVLIDPYAKLVEGRRVFGDTSHKVAKFLGTFDFSQQFDWGNDDSRSRIPEANLIIYEMNVRAFTADESSKLAGDLRGTYLGVIEKIPHLVELGINAVELLPVFEYDEFEFQRRPNPRDHMVNTWGYSTINFFSPMSRYASRGGGPIAASTEFKMMVKALHQAGIEVILDVVYNHTNEADDQFPYTTSFRGIDNLTYYMVDTTSFVQLRNYSGCGNTLDCNHPVVMELVLDSLKHWVKEYHVDGFRFDLASCLCRGGDGEPLSSPPVIRAIAKDPALANCKLIAEPWDCEGLYQVGCFPNWDRWAEWNGKYRDDVRRFIKGDDAMKSSFATRLSGSADMYHVNNRKPFHSLNFVIAHDGFSLYDLVAYNQKHNEANGEGGKDGSNDNFSWNCGIEGETSDPHVVSLRSRQMKNFHVALMLSLGTPMFLMGDEYAHTRFGNNNSYGHDTDLNHFQWDKLVKQASHFRFFQKVIELRKKHPLLGRDSFLQEGDVTWHETDWENPGSRFLAFTFHDKEEKGEEIYAAFNAHTFFNNILLPASASGRSWYRVIDTNLPSPADVIEDGIQIQGGTYNMAPFSAIVLLAKP
ncbi:hypothetical protein L7F22_008712 [Adiantum nelumboides]|nr:hypothetical protein [Adiantum nelumboides]